MGDTEGDTRRGGTGMMDPAHLLGTGGAIGAILRFGVDQWLDTDRFPVGTVVVNVVGTFVLGLVMFTGVGGEIALFIGTGACGSFTTYSSFSVRTVRLWETGERLRAALYKENSASTPTHRGRG